MFQKILNKINFTFIINFFFIVLSVYYIVSPTILVSLLHFNVPGYYDSIIFQQELEILNILNYDFKIDIIYNIFIFILCIFVFIITKNLFNIKDAKVISQEAILIILFFCLVFLTVDIVNLIQYRLENEIIYRSEIYYAVLNKRNTHVILIIFLSVANFKNNKLVSIICYTMLISFALLSLSRIELFYLVVFHFINHVNYKKKTNLIIFFLFFIFAVFYRIILHKFNLIYFLVEPLHTKLSSLIILENLQKIDFFDYLKQNLNYLLRDFFYIKTDIKNFINLAQYDPKYTTYSIRGMESIILYPIVFFIYILFLKMLIRFFYFNNYLNNIFCFYLLFSLFRGNIVHNLGFVIKLLILLSFTTWLIQKIKSLKSKAV